MSVYPMLTNLDCLQDIWRKKQWWYRRRRWTDRYTPT